MNVEEYFEKWWTPKDLPADGFNKTAMLDFAEMYHKQALRIHDVSRRSEQLCQHSWVKHPSHPKIGAMMCLKCGSELA